MHGSLSSDDLETREKRQKNYENMQTLNYAYMQHLEITFWYTASYTYDTII